MKQGLSRDDSLAVKGIAVLMLLFHHLYCSTGRFDGYAVSFFPFSEESIVELALLFKNCVSIFAFISSYGLLKSIAPFSLGTPRGSSGCSRASGSRMPRPFSSRSA